MFIVGCVSQAPYEQKIEGIVLRNKKGVKDVAVRFLSTYPENNCDAIHSPASLRASSGVHSPYLPIMLFTVLYGLLALSL